MKPWEVEMRVEAMLKQRAAETVLRQAAARDLGYVAQRLRRVVEQLTKEGVFQGMSETEVRALLREAVQDLNVSPDQGAN